MQSVYGTTKEAAHYLKLSARYLEDLRRKGGGPKFVCFGRAVRYAFKDLDSWAKSRQQSTSAQS